MLQDLVNFGAAVQGVLTGPHDLHPEEREAFVHVIAEVVDEEPALFKGDADKHRTMAYVETVAYREGGLRMRVHGDCSESKPGEPCKGTPHSFCSLQIHVTIGGSESLNDDPKACVRFGLRLLRQSMHICPDFPTAWYAVGGAGPDACRSDRGKRISNDRMNLAKYAERRASEKSAKAKRMETCREGNAQGEVCLAD